MVTPLAPNRCTEPITPVVGVVEERRDGPDDVGVAPEQGGHPDQNDQEAERDHEGALDGGAVQPAHQLRTRHVNGQQRRLDEEDDDHGERARGQC